MLVCLYVGSSVTAADPPQSPRPHSLIHRQTTENAPADAGVTTTNPGTPSAPSPATRPIPKKLTKRPADSAVAGQSAVPTTSPTPGSSPSGASPVQPSKTGTQTRGSVATTGLAALGTSMLSTAPLASGGASSTPSAPVAGKAPMASALAGASRTPSATPSGPAATGRGFQRLAAQLPGLTQLIAPTVSISSTPSSQAPSQVNSSSGPSPSPAPTQPSAPPPPAQAAPPVTGSATLSWSLNSETDLAGYKIYVGTAAGIYTYPGSPFVVGVTGTYTIAGLPSGQTYYFAISAYDYFGGESALSSEVSKSIY